MTQSNLQEIVKNAIKPAFYHMRKTLDLWCEFEPKIPCVTFRQHEEGTTTCVLFELANPVLYFKEMMGFTLNVNQGLATFSVSFGRCCSNPALAAKYVNRYKPEINTLGWSVNERFKRTSSLIISNEFSFESDADLLEKLIACMEDLRNEQLINELLVPLRYFENLSNPYY